MDEKLNHDRQNIMAVLMGAVLPRISCQLLKELIEACPEDRTVLGQAVRQTEIRLKARLTQLGSSPELRDFCLSQLTPEHLETQVRVAYLFAQAHLQRQDQRLLLRRVDEIQTKVDRLVEIRSQAASQALEKSLWEMFKKQYDVSDDDLRKLTGESNG